MLGLTSLLRGVLEGERCVSWEISSECREIFCIGTRNGAPLSRKTPVSAASVIFLQLKHARLSGSA